MCSYQDGWFDSFVWAEGRKNKLCPSLHMKPISIYYACTSFRAWYSGLWSQWQLWHWLQCAHPRRATSIISYSLVEVFFGHKLPISTQVTVSQKLFFFLHLSGLFLSFFILFIFPWLSDFSPACVYASAQSWHKLFLRRQIRSEERTSFIFWYLSDVRLQHL